MKAPYRFVPQGSKFAQLERGVPTGKTYASFEAARSETLRLNDAWRAKSGKRKNPTSEGRPTAAEIREFADVLYANSPLKTSGYGNGKDVSKWTKGLNEALYGRRPVWVHEFISGYSDDDLSRLKKILHEYQVDPYSAKPTKRRLYPQAGRDEELAELVGKMSMFANPRRNPENERERLEDQLESDKKNLTAVQWYLGPQAWQSGFRLSGADMERLVAQKRQLEESIKKVEAKLKR